MAGNDKPNTKIIRFGGRVGEGGKNVMKERYGSVGKWNTNGNRRKVHEGNKKQNDGKEKQFGTKAGQTKPWKKSQKSRTGPKGRRTR